MVWLHQFLTAVVLLEVLPLKMLMMSLLRKQSKGNETENHLEFLFTELQNCLKEGNGEIAFDM